MKAKVFKEMNYAELKGRLKELKEEYFNLRFQHATGQLTDANKLNFVKKDIARCMTFIRQKELSGKIEEEPAATAEKPKKRATKKAAVEEA